MQYLEEKKKCSQEEGRQKGDHMVGITLPFPAAKSLTY